jgi:hypothetical protein
MPLITGPRQMNVLNWGPNWGAALIRNFHLGRYHEMAQCCRSLKKLTAVIFSRVSQFQQRYIFDATWRLSARQQAPLTYPLDCAIRDVQCFFSAYYRHGHLFAWRAIPPEHETNGSVSVFSSIRCYIIHLPNSMNNSNVYPCKKCYINLQ